MWKLLLICIVMSALNSEAVRTTRRRRNNVGSYSGSYSNSNGANGGYTGTYNGNGGGVHVGTGNYDYDDYDGYGAGFGGYGIIDPYLFHQQLTNHVLAQNLATQQAITGLATAGDAFAFADATIDNEDTRIRQQIAAQQAYNDNIVRQNRYRPATNSGSYNLHRYAPSYAAAAGSIGPNGHRQTAYISPANPAQPNIVNRFGGSSSSGGGGGGGGYKGVSVSSFSTSNGDGTSRRGAQTTINDNGKVTSYSVHS
ncbi:RNA-binding protein FUS isoform X1 [Scaptodrosophila lebanonensis]|uniref:RNA-binding protein FUS isoform X1 n=1 Tax=Drosophila lebanonensis TaxID=7225 RepID=A0A6J2TQK1_DROLE|nr:RNA-binding protein FUS isoform X1 [Scaptodrosophila lebanonensis]XP_030377392.1 RNA-binding protein FUS isoform X1 [Scaptodrosophila lebanonensis]XP_030377393.1 RNA-binding protein FUS isoform X1 [Scaptodrosophila lebanonensis]XP_030377394.1 RNA-binding protein FUS isoform X1 [Scaptodrosophila lebanonensis]